MGSSRFLSEECGTTASSLFFLGLFWPRAIRTVSVLTPIDPRQMKTLCHLAPSLREIKSIQILYPRNYPACGTHCSRAIHVWKTRDCYWLWANRAHYNNINGTGCSANQDAYALCILPNTRSLTSESNSNHYFIHEFKCLQKVFLRSNSFLNVLRRSRIPMKGHQ